MSGFLSSTNGSGNVRIFRLIALLICCSIPLLLPDNAYAKDADPGGGGGITACYVNSGNIGPITRIVSCIKTMTKTAGTTLVSGLGNYLSTAVNAAVMISIVLYGMLLALGFVAQERPTSYTVVAIAKAACVMVFATNPMYFFDLGLDIMESLLDLAGEIVGDTIPADAHCVIGGDKEAIWMRMDCILGTFVGYVWDMGRQAAANPNGLVGPLAWGVLGFLIACFFSGGLAWTIAMFGVSCVLTLFMAVSRAVYTFLVAYTLLVFLAVLSPIFIPMIMFQSTRRFFDKWVAMCMTMIFQPLLLFVFLSVMLIAADQILLSGPYSIFRILGVNPGGMGALFDASDPCNPKNIIRYDGITIGILDIGKGLLDKVGFDVTAIFNNMPVVGGAVQWFNEHVITCETKKLLPGTITLPIPYVDLSHVDGQKLLLSTIGGAVFAYLMNTMLKYIPDLSQEIFMGSTMRSIGTVKTPLEERFFSP